MHNYFLNLSFSIITCIMNRYKRKDNYNNNMGTRKFTDYSYYVQTLLLNMDCFFFQHMNGIF